MSIEAIDGFLRVIHANALDKDGNYDPEYEVEIRMLGGKSVARPPYNGFTTVQAAARFAVTLNAQGCDAYYGPHLRKRGCGKAGNANVVAFACAFADIDCDKHGVTRERVLAVLAACPWGPPTTTTNSGGGFHPIWAYRELLDASDPDNVAIHQKVQRYVQWYVNDQIGVDCADDMSSLDRILRLPGTYNQKPERRRPDGSQPLATVVDTVCGGLIEPADILAFQPTDVKWDTAKHDVTPLDPNSLPKTLPERIKRVLAAAGIRITKLKVDTNTGGLSLLEVGKCPACGDTRGKCFITAFGRLKSHRDKDCPAGKEESGDYGIPLDHWVFRFAPQAKGALATPPDAGQLKRPMQHRVAIAWGELALEPGDSGLRAWLAKAGFHPDIGDQIVESGLALCPLPELIDEEASRLAHGIATSRHSDEVLLAVQDVEGHTRLAAWLSELGNVRMLSHLATESLGDMPDGLGVLGDVPAAVAAGAAGRAVVVAMDPRDWLTAQAMRDAGLLDAEVVGVLRQRDAVALCQALKRRWTLLGVLPPRAVILRRREFSGTLSLEAAKRLAGRAGAAICEPTTADAKQGGLTESAALFGPESAARAIKTAAWRHEPPTDIATSGPALASFLDQSVNMAMAKTTHGRLKLVVCVVDPGGGKTTAMLDVATRASAGQTPLPVNGRRPTSVDAAAWPPPGRRIGFWLPSHALAAEKRAQLMAMERDGKLSAPAVNTVQIKGALEWCAFKAHVKDVFPVVGRRGICGDPDSEQRCPEATAGCLGAVEPHIDFGQIAFGAHAMAANVRQDIAIIDESPGVFDENAVDSVAMASLFTPRILPRVKRWRLTENEDAPIAARLLSDAVQARANEHADNIGAGRADGYDRHIRGADLVALIDATPDLAESLRIGAHKAARKPPVPFPNELRGGAFSLSSYPSRAAFYALQALLSHYQRLKGVKPEADEELVVLDQSPKTPEPIVVLTLRPDRTWAIQQLQVRRLPDCPVVMLDATGEITLDEWKAAYPDRDVIVRRMRVQGTAPALALHLETKQFRRRRIWLPDGTMTEKTAARVRSAITRTVLETRRKVPRSPGERPEIGVLLYKGIWGLITGAVPPTCPAEQVIAGIKMLTDELNVNVRWGYFGRHDRSTNEFENVAALLVMGDPLENVGHVELQAGLLGLDAEKIGRQRAEATLVQAIFRARHTRRNGQDRPPVVLVHVGERPPDIDGMDWDREPLIEHRRTHTGGKLGLAYAAVEYVAEQLEDVVGTRLMQWFDFSGSPFGRKIQDEIDERTWRDACRAYARARGNIEVTIQVSSEGRPCVMFGPDEATVREVADQAFCLKSPRNGQLQQNSGFPEAENTPKNGTCGHETTGRSLQSPGSGAVSGERRNMIIERWFGEAPEGGSTPPGVVRDEGAALENADPQESTA